MVAARRPPTTAVVIFSFQHQHPLLLWSAIQQASFEASFEHPNGPASPRLVSLSRVVLLVCRAAVQQQQYHITEYIFDV